MNLQEYNTRLYIVNFSNLKTYFFILLISRLYNFEDFLSKKTYQNLQALPR